MTTTQPPAGMRFREYKGVTYNPMDGQYLQGGLWLVNGASYETIALMIVQQDHLTDDDHAPLMALKQNPLEPAPPAPVERDEVWKVVSGLLDRVWNVAKSYGRYGDMSAFPAWEGTDTITAAILRAVQDRIDTVESAHRADREAVLAACGVSEQTEDTLAAQVRKAIAQGTPTVRPTATLSTGPTILDPQWRWVGDALETRYPDEPSWKPALSIPVGRWREIVGLRITDWDRATLAELIDYCHHAQGRECCTTCESTWHARADVLSNLLALHAPAETRGVE